MLRAYVALKYKYVIQELSLFTTLNEQLNTVVKSPPLPFFTLFVKSTTKDQHKNVEQRMLFCLLAHFGSPVKNWCWIKAKVSR